MKRYRHILFAVWIVLVCLFESCTKNEFTVVVEQASTLPPIDLEIVYYASDARQGWVVTRDITAGMTQPVICQTRNGTVGFVMASARMVTVFWAERGDRIQLHYRDGFWIASGNAVTDSLADWQARNRNLILANATGDLNKRVAAYVESHPGRREAAILLYVYFSGSADGALFDKLRGMLRSDAASAEMERVLGRVPQTPESAEKKIPALHLRSMGDSLPSVRPQDAPATVYLFWNDVNRRSERVKILRRLLKGRNDIRVVDINMQADTMNWRTTVAADSVRSWIRLWAPGAEQNTALVPLGLPGPDFIIVADRRGNAAYRGTEAAQAAAAALKFH